MLWHVITLKWLGFALVFAEILCIIYIYFRQCDLQSPNCSKNAPLWLIHLGKVLGNEREIKQILSTVLKPWRLRTETAIGNHHNVEFLPFSFCTIAFFMNRDDMKTCPIQKLLKRFDRSGKRHQFQVVLWKIIPFSIFAGNLDAMWIDLRSPVSPFCRKIAPLPLC